MTGNIIAFLVGIVCIVLGISNMQGNISSLHSYHRQRVSEEDRMPFGKQVGLGTVIVGIGIIVFSVLSTVTLYTENNLFILVGTTILIVGIILGLSLASVLYKAGGVRYGECHLIDEEGYNIYDVEKHKTYEEWKEAIPLYEKVLQTLPRGKLRDRATDELSQLYLNLGEHEKGMALADLAPDMWSSRDFLRAYACDGKAYVKAHSELLLQTIRASAVLIVNITAGDQQHLSVHDKAENIARAIRLFEVICPDGNFGCHHAYVVSLELLRSLYLWLDNRQDEAFAALENARKNGLEFIRICEDGVARFCAPLVRLAEEVPICGVDIARQDYLSMAEDWPWWTVPEVEQVKAEIQADPRWDVWVASIQL